MKSQQVALVNAAVTLRSHSNEAWDQFLSALDEYATSVVENCVSANLTDLPTAQGRAQAMRALARELRNAPQTAQSLRTKK